MNTRQKLKRNISTDVQKPPVKKPKTRKPLETRYETPHPSALSESQIYKLPSSVGPYLSPSDFSPIPKAPSYNRSISHRKTSSTNLKENAITRSGSLSNLKKARNPRKYGKSRNKSSKKQAFPLESPFNSCSSSASSASSPDSLSTRQFDKGVHPNIPKSLSQSACNSPAESPTKTRRPSVPAPTRLADWNYKPLQAASAIDLHAFKHDSDQPRRSLDVADHASQDIFLSRSPTNFNRPPSQLSMYDYNRSVTYDDDVEMKSCLDDIASGKDEFLAGIRGTSTPFKLLNSSSASNHRVGGSSSSVPLSTSVADLHPTVADTDTDNDSCGWSDSDQDIDTVGHNNSIFRTLKLLSKNRSSSGYVTPSEHSDDEDQSGQTANFRGSRSPWISDSLISPPKTADWGAHLRAQRGAYMQPHDSLMDVDKEADGADVVPDHELEGMFDSLVLAPESDQDVSSKFQDPLGTNADRAEIHLGRGPGRTRSLDESIHSQLSTPQNADHKVASSAEVLTAGTRRTRSGTIVAASSQDVLPAPALPRRTRSGTVVASHACGSNSASGVSGGDGLPSALPVVRGEIRRMNGTVVSGSSGLAPSLPIVEERQLDSPRRSPLISPAVFSSKRARSGSIVALSAKSLAPVGDDPAANPTPAFNIALPPRRNRSGSIIALGTALANLPSQAVGMAKRTRSGTVVARAPALPQVELVAVSKEKIVSSSPADSADTKGQTEELVDDFNEDGGDVEKYPQFAPNPEAETPALLSRANQRSGAHDDVYEKQGDEEGDEDGDDPLNMLLDHSSPNLAAGHAWVVEVPNPDAKVNVSAANACSVGLRARARAAASKAKGLGKTLAAKNAKGKAIHGPAAGAAAVARAKARARLEKRAVRGDGSGEKGEENISSDDELLLKPGNVVF